MLNHDKSLVTFSTQALLSSNSSEQPYWQVATSINTRKAYLSDIRHFRKTGGVLPATIESILHYLNQQASIIKPRTLKRRLVAIKHWHTYQNFADPTVHLLIKKKHCAGLRVRMARRPIISGDNEYASNDLRNNSMDPATLTRLRNEPK